MMDYYHLYRDIHLVQFHTEVLQSSSMNRIFVDSTALVKPFLLESQTKINNDRCCRQCLPTEMKSDEMVQPKISNRLKSLTQSSIPLLPVCSHLI